MGINNIPVGEGLIAQIEASNNTYNYSSSPGLTVKEMKSIVEEIMFLRTRNRIKNITLNIQK